MRYAAIVILSACLWLSGFALGSTDVFLDILRTVDIARSADRLDVGADSRDQSERMADALRVECRPGGTMLNPGKPECD
jgi:hypothetical protein